MPHRQSQMLAAIALGGALGGLARFAVAEAVPTRANHLPWGP